MQDEVEHLEIYRLFRHLLGSIRELNKRIRELKWVAKEVLQPGPEKKKVIARIEKLNETRMCLIYSMLDIRKRASEALSMNIELGTLHKELKDL